MRFLCVSCGRFLFSATHGFDDTFRAFGPCRGCRRHSIFEAETKALEQRRTGTDGSLTKRTEGAYTTEQN